MKRIKSLVSNGMADSGLLNAPLAKTSEMRQFACGRSSLSNRGNNAVLPEKGDVAMERAGMPLINIEFPLAIAGD